MQKVLWLLSMLCMVFFFASCEKDDDAIAEDPNDPVVEVGVDTMVTADGVQFVRTPDFHFKNLPDWNYSYQYVEIDGLRQAYAEAGPAGGEVVLLLHGQPSWSYLYRKMIPVLADAGYRVIAMDHLGMGRSDKPIDIDDYSYLGHADRLGQFIQRLGLQQIHLFAQDWGAIIGLRVAGLNPDWFASIAIGNGDLPIGLDTQPFPTVENPGEVVDMEYPFTYFSDQQTPFYDGCDLITGGLSEEYEIVTKWQNYAMKGSEFRASQIIENHTWYPVSIEEQAAYDAPFPSREYMAGIRAFPSIINEFDVLGLNEDAWEGLLSGNQIDKFHTVGFNAWSTINILVSPEEEYYVLISRDGAKTQEVPTIPSTWQEVKITITEELILELPNPTLNIRTDNEDSYQGPIPKELLGV